MSAFWEWFFTSEMSVEIPSRPIKGPPAFMLLMLVVVVISCVWGASDARRRGKSPLWTAVFILCAWWPISLLWWSWLRPPVPNSRPCREHQPG